MMVNYWEEPHSVIVAPKLPLNSAPAIPISPKGLSVVFNTDVATDHDQRSVLEAKRYQLEPLNH